MACQPQTSVHHLRRCRSPSSRVLDSVRRPRHARQAAVRHQGRRASQPICAHTRRDQQDGERRHSAREEDGTEGGHYLLDQECGLCHRLGRRWNVYLYHLFGWTSDRAAHTQVICHDLNGRKSAKSCSGQKALESIIRLTLAAHLNPRPGLGRT